MRHILREKGSLIFLSLFLTTDFMASLLPFCFSLKGPADKNRQAPPPHRGGGWGVGLLLLLASCSGTKYIPEGSKLYTGSAVKLKSEAPIPNEAALQTELESVIRPKPNTSILGLRPKLYFWHLGQGKTKGLGKWLADRYGEKPVLLSEVDTQRVKGLLINRLYNNGYFAPVVHSRIQTKGQTASVDYNASLNKPYLIKEIHFPQGDSLLPRAVRATQAGSLLKVGDPYNLQTFTNERVRIDGELKNQGFYYFAPDYILFQVDSTLDNQVNVYLTVKPTTPPRAAKPYILNRIRLNTDYSLSDTTLSERPIRYRGYIYYPDEEVFSARSITNATFLYPDSLYRRRRQDQTLSRLMSLGVFKFVDIRFRPAANKPDSAGYGFLNSVVRMTQVPKKSLRAEVQFVSKANGFVGPGFRVQYRNRSALRGAEQLLVNLTGSFENQRLNDATTIGLTSYELGLDAQLQVPRLITPPLPFLDVRLPSSDFQPRTFFGANVRRVERREAFIQDVFGVNYGYTWKTRVTNEQELRPIDVQYIRTADTSRAFSRLLQERPFLETSFRQQFVLASSYRYTYNQQALEQRRNQIYFSGGVEVAGNLARLVSSLTGQPRDADGSYTLLGQEFAQYAKFDLELRNYFRISPLPTSGNKLATRLLLGLGLPYQNSRVLPYLRQYGIGGPNSIRAFPARGVGPGTYRPPVASENNSFYDQVGDIRIEGNIEYRQDLFPYVKGALFVDAGNIWLVNPDSSRQTIDAQGNPDSRNGQFAFNSFLKELAIGAGIGLRIDVQFFVIRLDLAYPITYPYDNVDIRNADGSLIYRSQPKLNILDPRLNIAIGYPF
ncbi:translocation and assembly module lipoprotein TamL [Hymenobacter weizhouensis]|uniref:translocation and assembly module lipoprotein TamL n=1 Tax=Hymenobacter sp. YIM 151500-1 TaxID=2987689 RepID=UPI002226A4FD|nr:BamA/TamA family outer membrane protein [Hymenobacter sp. YIM 151500-1]UYZ62345.1 BamA/TamA family outer membrane protein [Hymenobacter sp. YIM 151500-1]